MPPHERSEPFIVTLPSRPCLRRQHGLEARVAMTAFLRTVVFIAVATMAVAVRAQDQQSDLATQFFCRAPQTEITQQTEITNRIKALIMQQANALTAQLQPWGKDPTALLVGPGTSDENCIRTNAHICFGLAIMARC